MSPVWLQSMTAYSGLDRSVARCRSVTGFHGKNIVLADIIKSCFFLFFIFSCKPPSISPHTTIHLCLWLAKALDTLSTHVVHVSRHHNKDLASTLQTTLASETISPQVSQPLKQDKTLKKKGLLTESAQYAPSRFVNSVSPFQGLSRRARLQPSSRRVTCWKDSMRSSAVFRRMRSKCKNARRKYPRCQTHSGPWW